VVQYGYAGPVSAWKQHKDKQPVWYIWRGEEILFLPSGINFLFPAHTVTFKSKYFLHHAFFAQSQQQKTRTNSLFPSTDFTSKTTNRFSMELVFGVSTDSCTENLILTPIHSVLTTTIRETLITIYRFSQKWLFVIKMCHISFLLSSSNQDEMNFLVYTILSFVPMPYRTRMRTCGLLQLGAYILM